LPKNSQSQGFEGKQKLELGNGQKEDIENCLAQKKCGRTVGKDGNASLKTGGEKTGCFIRRGGG